MIVTVREILIENEIAKSHLFLSAVENKLREFYSDENTLLNLKIKENLNEKYSESGILCLLILDKKRHLIYSNGIRCEFKYDLEEIVKHAILTKKKANRFIGNTGGVFWKQKRNLVAAIPLFHNKHIIAGVGTVVNIEGVYSILRKVQSITWFYFLANIVILSLLGIYRFSKLIVKPVHRLISRLEEYDENQNGIFLIKENERNEFNKLSKALNRIVNGVSKDKEKLQSIVSSLSKANTDLKKAQNDLIRAEKFSIVGRLSSGLAHEIGNPIGIISGYFELLKQDDISDEEKNEYIVRAESELSRIHTIIQQLLNFTRPDTENLIILSVDKIIEEIIHDLKFQPLMSKIEINLDLRAKEKEIMANPNKLRQVFLNLIINASDAILSSKNRLNGKIIFKTDVIKRKYNNCLTQSSILRIICVDNGAGIEKDCIKNIFEPFYTTKEPGKGTGLGLWVCSMIVEAMGGKIKAKSAKGEGTSIIIYFPIYNKEKKMLSDG